MSDIIAKKVLVVWGGWKGHEPKQCVDKLVPWMESKGYNVTVSDTQDAYLDEEAMKTYALIIPCWTMGDISGPQSKALIQAVRNGAGLAGWHGGMCDAFRNNTEYQFMTGGQWVSHPGGVIDYSVTGLDQTDEITNGLKDFAMHSEQYYMHTDPGNQVLATTIVSGQHGDVPWTAGTVMPVVWKRMWGKGRVFYSSLGHVASDFDVPEVLEIMKRGIQWAARETIVPEYTSK